MQQSGARTHRVPGQSAMQRGERFKKAIYERAAPRGWTTDVAIAEAASVSTNTLGNWWKGKAPELGSLVGLADALDQSLWDLLNLWQGRPRATPEPTVAGALTTLADELRAWRTEDRARIAELEATVARLVAGVLDGRGTPGEAGPRALRAEVE